MSKLLHYALVPLILRLVLGGVFIGHGLQKIPNASSWASQNPKAPEAVRELPSIVQVLVAFGEFLGGIALVIGILTRFAAFGLAAIMTGAIFLVHLPNGFSNSQGGFEYPLVLGVISLAVVLTGSGAFGFDHWFKFRNKDKN